MPEPTPILARRVFKREPVLVVLGGLAAVLNLGLLAANANGLADIPDIGAIIAFVDALCLLAIAALRSTIDSPATVEAKVATTIADKGPLSNNLRRLASTDLIPAGHDTKALITAAAVLDKQLGPNRYDVKRAGR